MVKREVLLGAAVPAWSRHFVKATAACLGGSPVTPGMQPRSCTLPPHASASARCRRKQQERRMLLCSFRLSEQDHQCAAIRLRASTASYSFPPSLEFTAQLEADNMIQAHRQDSLFFCQATWLTVQKGPQHSQQLQPVMMPVDTQNITARYDKHVDAADEWLFMPGRRMLLSTACHDTRAAECQVLTLCPATTWHPDTVSFQVMIVSTGMGHTGRSTYHESSGYAATRPDDHP